MYDLWYCVLIILFFKQKTAYEMRISDWSSDVCSSDLLRLHLGLVVPEPHEHCWIEVGGQRYAWQEGRAVVFDDLYPHQVHNDTAGQLGRASGRERVCQDV